MSDRGHSVGYYSSYDRGLEALLDMWPEIKRQVPDATLTIAYGWNTYDSVHKHDPAKMKWKWQMIRKMHDVGAKEVGRLNHEELAKLMKQTKVWAYPTEFTEIYAITAVKAQEAGCIPVVTNVAALKETVQSGMRVEADDIYTNKERQAKFVDCVITALESETKIEPVPNTDWSDVAKQWNEVLSA